MAGGRRSSIRDVHKILAFSLQILTSYQTLSCLSVFYDTWSQSRQDKCHILRNESKLVQQSQKSRRDLRLQELRVYAYRGQESVDR